MALKDEKARLLIQDKFELAYFISESMGVKVLEIIYPNDNSKSRWMIINSSNKRDKDNDYSYVHGYDFTEFFQPNRLNKTREVLSQELQYAIQEKEANELTFSEHFAWFLYKFK